MASFKPGDRVAVMETKKYTAEVVGPVIPHTGLIMIKTAPDGVTFLVRKDTLRKLVPRTPRLRGWVNVYKGDPDYTGPLHLSREAAEEWDKGSGCGVLLRCVEVVEVRRRK